MKIALLGYGKMGALVEQVAHAKGHSIVARFSRGLGIVQDHLDDLALADLAIDFSQSEAVIEHLLCCLSLKKPLVIGTTGWEKDLPQARQLVEEAKGCCLYAPNFSIGAYLFQLIVGYASSLFQSFDDYDVTGIEYHHRQKIDQPSGTAKAIRQTVLKHLPRIPNFEFSSVRCGYAAGTHTLHFDGPMDTLTFTHEARHRQGFAEGAITAAEWVFSKQGFFTIDELMKDALENDS